MKATSSLKARSYSKKNKTDIFGQRKKENPTKGEMKIQYKGRKKRRGWKGVSVQPADGVGCWGDRPREPVINGRRARWAVKRCGIRGHVATGGPTVNWER